MPENPVSGEPWSLVESLLQEQIPIPKGCNVPSGCLHCYLAYLKHTAEEEMDILFDCSQEECRILLESIKTIKPIRRHYNITK